MDTWDEWIVKTAKILYLIAATPNPRKQPSSSDISGNFELWFDGGALRNDTGATNYKFWDGTCAYMHVIPFFAVGITFPDGKTLKLVEDKQ